MKNLRVSPYVGLAGVSLGNIRESRNNYVNVFPGRKGIGRNKPCPGHISG